MLLLPRDLEPLPDYEWDERPEYIPLRTEEVRAALWLSGGNIGATAKSVGVKRARVNRFIRMSEYLHGEWIEIMEQILDRAEWVVRDALENPTREPGRDDAMAKFVLRTQGKQRGWGNSKSATPKSESVRLVWADGQAI